MKLEPRERRPAPDYLFDNRDSLGLGWFYLGWGSKKKRAAKPKDKKSDATDSGTKKEAPVQPKVKSVARKPAPKKSKNAASSPSAATVSKIASPTPAAARSGTRKAAPSPKSKPKRATAKRPTPHPDLLDLPQPTARPPVVQEVPLVLGIVFGCDSSTQFLLTCLDSATVGDLKDTIVEQMEELRQNNDFVPQCSRNTMVLATGSKELGADDTTLAENGVLNESAIYVFNSVE